MILVLIKETNGSKSCITFLQRKELMSFLVSTHLHANCERHQNHIFQCQYISLHKDNISLEKSTNIK